MEHPEIGIGYRIVGILALVFLTAHGYENGWYSDVSGIELMVTFIASPAIGYWIGLLLDEWSRDRRLKRYYAEQDALREAHEDD